MREEMENIKYWTKEDETKDYTEWKHISLPKAIVVQETPGSGWYVFELQDVNSRKGDVRTIDHDRYRQNAEEKAMEWMRVHPNG